MQYSYCAAMAEAALSAGQTAWSTFPTRHRMLSTVCTHAQPWPAMPLPQPLLFKDVACSASARSLSPSTHATCPGRKLSVRRCAGPSGKYHENQKRKQPNLSAYAHILVRGVHSQHKTRLTMIFKTHTARSTCVPPSSELGCSKTCSPFQNIARTAATKRHGSEQERTHRDVRPRVRMERLQAVQREGSVHTANCLAHLHMAPC